MRLPVIVFAAVFGLYLAGLPPALAPYRDAGEMTASAATLGVSHPTGYPLYILLGHLAQLVPIGNPGYRMGLLSAAAGALAAAVVCGLTAARWGWAAGLGAAALLALNPTFWSVALVPEMYSLWMLGAACLLGLAWRVREYGAGRLWYFWCFLYGFLLTNRLDLVLWAPGLLCLALSSPAWNPRRAGLWAAAALIAAPVLVVLTGSNLLVAVLAAGTLLWLGVPGRGWAWGARSLGWGLLGLGVYLFLPLRSATGPWLDWNHPATLSNFVESVLRTRYGGTLDLLSKSYAPGELWRANVKMYGAHLWEGFFGVGLAAVAMGVWSAARKDPGRGLALAAAWWWSGPVFLYLANMPPNPHAAAIVEPHYLLSDLILVFFAAEGLGALGAVPPAAAALAAAAIIAVPFAQGRWPRMQRRNHMFTYDYARNILRSVPQGGVLVAKKDVQLYTLWHFQVLHEWRPDVRVVAQGLAGSPWYQKGWARRDLGLRLRPLRDALQWKGFVQENAPVFATPDAEVPPDAVARRQRGLVGALGPAAGGDWDLTPALWKLAALRGDYRYEDQPDFFTSDLIADYARALYARASELSRAGAAEAAGPELLRAWGMQWVFPEPAVLLGYLMFTAGRLEDAQRYYELAVAVHERMRRLTEEYHSLPNLKQDLARGAAEARMHLGVLAERRGDRDAAEKLYRESLARAPLAQTHYNLAVLYWNRDWGAVERELTAALRLDPAHADAAKYLAMLKARR